MPSMQHLLKVMTFWVSVPVLSEKTCCTWPSWSLRLVLRASAGMSCAVWYMCTSQPMKVLFPRWTNSALRKRARQAPPGAPGPRGGGRPGHSRDEQGHGHHDTEQDEEAPEDGEGLGGYAARELGLELPHLVPEAEGQRQGDKHQGQEDLFRGSGARGGV